MSAAFEFRNLAGRPLEPALAQLLELVLGEGRRAVVVAGAEARVKALDAVLWTWRPDAFLPHGAAPDPYAARQPVWLTDRVENPNGATVAVLLDDAELPDDAAFERCVYLFDASDPAAREAGRRRYRGLLDAGRSPSYWELGSGGWRRQR